MNNIIVYCEIEEGVISDVSLELLSKGRKLANDLKCQLEALVIGIATVAIGTVVRFIVGQMSYSKLPKLCKDWNKYYVMDQEKRR